MSAQKPRASTIKEEVAGLRASHDVHMEALAARLDGITERLDQINGNVRSHAEWIAGRNPVCERNVRSIDALTSAVAAIDLQHSRETGIRVGKAEVNVSISKRRAAAMVAGGLLCQAITTWAAVWVLR